MYPLIRAWFRIVGHIAPGVAERHAARLFLTPRRRRRVEPFVYGIHSERRVLFAGGRRVVVWSWGEGPVVLLVHGWSGRSADLTSLAGTLARAGFRAVTADMPAHGSSAGRSTSLAEWAPILTAVARLHGEMPRAIVGHSAGAIAAALLLERGLSARGVVLIAPAEGPEMYIERVSTLVGLPSARVAGMTRHVVKTVGRELAHFDPLRLSRSMNVPALIIHDPADDVVPFAHAEKMAGAWSGSSLVRVHGVGHYQILKSSATIARIVSFIRALHPEVRSLQPSSVARDANRFETVAGSELCDAIG